MVDNKISVFYMFITMIMLIFNTACMFYLTVIYRNFVCEDPLTKDKRFVDIIEDSDIVIKKVGGLSAFIAALNLIFVVSLIAYMGRRMKFPGLGVIFVTFILFGLIFNAVVAGYYKKSYDKCKKRLEVTEKRYEAANIIQIISSVLVVIYIIAGIFIHKGRGTE